jgi:hypothetical protein
LTEFCIFSIQRNFLKTALKALTAIPLLILFAFNLFGYNFLFYYAQKASDKQVQTSLDHKQYNDAELITITVPLSLPYYLNTSDFERFDGEINIDGKIYRYVERKVANGELILKCLPDYNKMQLQSAKIDFFKSANDFVQNTDTKKSSDAKTNIYKYSVNDYDAFRVEYGITSFESKKIKHSPSLTDRLMISPRSLPEHPPQAV